MSTIPPDSAYDVFLSYASLDDRPARKVLKALSREGLSTFSAQDTRSLVWGEDLTSWFGEIYARTSAVMFLVSQNFAKSSACLRELSALCEMHDATKRPSLLPVRLDDTPLPNGLQDIFALDFRHGSVDELAKAARMKIDEIRSSSVDPTTLPSSVLASRIAAGDEDAFGTLVERMAPRAFLMAHRISNNNDDAEDIVQEAFLRFYRRAGSIEPDTNLETWFLTVVKNVAIDVMRRKLLREATTETESTKLPVAALERELMSLDRDDQKIITLHAFDGLSLADVASAMGLPETLTAARYHRAFRWLRQATALKGNA